MHTKTLEKNVINCFGQKGATWHKDLPTIIQTLSSKWSLSALSPVNNMTYNYVAMAIQHQKNVVLKISCDKQLILDEYKALQHFDGHGSIQVYDMDPAYYALLLEQAIPGDLLKKQYPQNLIETVNIYANVVKALGSRPLPKNHKYTHVSKWLEAFARITDPSIEKRFIEKAKELRAILLNSNNREYLCHGDLHLENIIKHHSKWLVIDPKGIVGEIAFEAAAFDLINKGEMKKNHDIQSLIVNRVTNLSKALEIDYNHLLSWFFLRVIMSAQWFIEDNGDPSYMLALGNSIFPLLK